MNYKVGDIVKVICSARSYENGWPCNWQPDMDKFVGKVGEIVTISWTGIQIKSMGQWRFPHFVLEKVDSMRTWYFANLDEYIDQPLLFIAILHNGLYLCENKAGKLIDIHSTNLSPAPPECDSFDWKPKRTLKIGCTTLENKDEEIVTDKGKIIGRIETVLFAVNNIKKLISRSDIADLKLLYFIVQDSSGQLHPIYCSDLVELCNEKQSK